MKPVLLGVISKNLCIKKASSTSSTISFNNKGGKHDDIEFFDKLLQKPSWDIFVYIFKCSKARFIFSCDNIYFSANE